MTVRKCTPKVKTRAAANSHQTLMQLVCSVLHIMHVLQKQLKENANKTTGRVTTIGQLITPKKKNKQQHSSKCHHLFFKFQQSSLNTMISSGKSVLNDSITETILSSLCTSVLSLLALLLQGC